MATMRFLLNEIAHVAKGIGKTFVFFYVPVIIVLVLLHFPYDTDQSANLVVSQGESAVDSAASEASGFYEVAYRADTSEPRGLDYEATARAAAEFYDIEGNVGKFVADHGLAGKKILEVGSGRGYLQDIVHDYTGLDLSPSVARFYHKPFVVGSATDMPFPESSFDALWTVWVLEHIPEPEKALTEMRRVLKPNGLLFLYVAWNCTPWAADGFEVRPYRDFNLLGKAVKASIAVRQWPLFTISYLYPIRAARWAYYEQAGEDASLRFRALDPNYDTYWQPDSDAAISLDNFETYLWFRARGDECLNCGSPGDELMKVRDVLILRINKP
jgi:SAM-dependent methyltransferase